MTIDQDDFEAWRVNPITEAVFKLLRAEAEDAKETWLQHSWGAGLSSGEVLHEMKGRANICEMLLNLRVEDLNEDDDEQKRD